MTLPLIIQGGMGVAVSNWRLARAVATRGQIGVVSGTALDVVLARRLQAGDPGGHMRRALGAFPNRDLAKQIVETYFVDGGKPGDAPYKAKPMIGDKPSRRAVELLVAANFVEVFLAKEGHHGIVGINYLHKIQSPLLPSLYGAMLAGVDIVIVGAGIPLEVPAVIDGLCENRAVEATLHLRDAPSGQTHRLSFNPADIVGQGTPLPPRPKFFPIVSSATLATLMVKKTGGKVDGLIIEEPSAGGHNAPPRGPARLNERGEPIYGPRDAIDLDAIKALNCPFWLAGSYASPERFQAALDAGAAGVQVGTLFAFSAESGLRDDLKRRVLRQCAEQDIEVFRDPVASPTGFPFQVLSIPGTLSEPEVYQQRPRVCDLGYLREGYERPDGTVGWRCCGEDPDEYVKKGGKLEDTVGRKCLCNALMANIGLPQHRGSDDEELPLVTCGSDLDCIRNVLKPGATSYTAADALDYLLTPTQVA